MTTATTGPARCVRHPATSTTMRCDSCERPYCRDCLVSRFITNRSSVWLCADCAAGGGVARAAYGRPRSGLSLPRLSPFWWLVIGLALFAFLATARW